MFSSSMYYVVVIQLFGASKSGIRFSVARSRCFMMTTTSTEVHAEIDQIGQ